MKGRKFISAFMITTLLTIPLIATNVHAGWFGGHVLPIRPGDHVFDAKRFADSIRETIQQGLVFKNMVEQLKNLNLKNMGTTISYLTESLSTFKLPNLDGIMGNPNKPSTYTSYGAHNTYGADVLYDNMFPRLVIGEREANNNNLFTLSTRLNSSITSSQDAMTKTLSNDTPGIRGEGQKSHVLEALQGYQRGEYIQYKAAQLIQKLEKDQLERQTERFEHEKASVHMQTITTDPYHPTEFTEMHKKDLPVQTKAIGMPDL